MGKGGVMRCVYPIADTLNAAVEFDGKVVTGVARRTIDLGPLQLNAELKIVNSIVQDDGAVVLCEGPGDLGLLICYNPTGNQVQVSVVDFTALDGGEPKFLFDQEDGLTGALAIMTPGIVKTFRNAGEATSWQEV